MANKNIKVKQNVAGKYYVDTSCIYCGQCHSIVPDFFVDDDQAGYMYVAKQPLTRDDTDLCESALVTCPVNAIGNDGA